MNQLYDPAKISAWQLPIAEQACHAYSELWHVKNAKQLCQLLMKYNRIPQLTDEDYAAIASVAAGGIWPVPDRVYDDEQWTKDRTLNAVPGQEITSTIYYHMFNVLPPLGMPITQRTMCYSGGFLVSQPYTYDPCSNSMLYSAYGRKGDRYYYIGLLPYKRP